MAQPVAQKPTDIIAPEKLDFRLYMNTDANHLNMENMVPSLSVSLTERAKRENVIALLAPLMRLNVETIKTLSRGKLTCIEGVFTIGDLEVSGDKNHLAFLHVDIDGATLAEKRSGGASTDDYQFFINKQALLLESGHWNSTTHSFEFVYRWPGDSQISKTVILRLSNLTVKNPGTPIGQYLESIVRAPGGMPVYQPSQPKHNKQPYRKHRGNSQPLPNPTQPPNPNAPPPGPVFINPNNNNYSDPPPKRRRWFW